MKLSTILTIFITLFILGCSSTPPPKGKSVYNDSDIQKENSKQTQREMSSGRRTRY